MKFPLELVAAPSVLLLSALYATVSVQAGAAGSIHAFKQSSLSRRAPLPQQQPKLSFGPHGGSPPAGALAGKMVRRLKRQPLGALKRAPEPMFGAMPILNAGTAQVVGLTKRDDAVGAMGKHNGEQGTEVNAVTQDSTQGQSGTSGDSSSGSSSSSVSNTDSGTSSYASTTTSTVSDTASTEDCEEEVVDDDDCEEEDDDEEDCEDEEEDDEEECDDTTTASTTSSTTTSSTSNSGSSSGGSSSGSSSSSSNNNTQSKSTSNTPVVQVQAKYNAPSSSASAPAASSSAKSSSTSSAASSGSTSTTGTKYSGIATFFSQNGNAGACGKKNSEDSKVIALPSGMWDGGKHCGRTVNIYNTQDGTSVTATVADLCPTCEGSQSIDLSIGAMSAIDKQYQTHGIRKVEWWYTS